jgi:3-phenylpropionate/trans-cinnamate dioxygenase ferredoxin component
MTLERLCSIHELAPGEARRFDLGKLRIALVRVGDDWYAVGDTCTHQNISLSEGEVHEDTREIECWKHGSCFSLETGEPSSLPATRPVPVFGVRVDGEDVLVDLP